jgi:tetratricopeptide (TPR) repeat protein
MFFPKLRARAKWVFVLLAVAFGGGFVIFGVGSNLPSGLGDILQDVTHDSAPSVSDARERVQENPRDPAAQLALSEALQQNQRPDEAIVPLEAYIKLRPRDEDALRELAGLYSSKANRLTEEVTFALIRFQEASTGQLVQPKLSGQAGSAFFQSGAIETPVLRKASEDYTKVTQEMSQAWSDAQRIYLRIQPLAPRDPQLQLLLANAATEAQDLPVAISAYERFLKLAPEDSSVPEVKQALRSLRQQQRSAAASPPATPLGGGG